MSANSSSDKPLGFSIVKTPWGSFGFVAQGQRLVATYLPISDREVRQTIQSRFPEAYEDPNLLPDFRKQVADYFEGRRCSFDVEFELNGITPFRRKVLQACSRVPFGKTISYGELARKVGSPNASRAVGSAMANNPMPLVIPCHRVVASNAGIGGFSSPDGVTQKLRMLQLENARPLETRNKRTGNRKLNDRA